LVKIRAPALTLAVMIMRISASAARALPADPVALPNSVAIVEANVAPVEKSE
jgi:hypothetical protein